MRDLHGDDVEVVELEADRVSTGRYMAGPRRIPAGLALLAMPFVIIAFVATLILLGGSLYVLVHVAKDFMASNAAP